MNVRVRFAPSPTGSLHIGGVRTALFNWLFARHHNGTFLLRIEDTDVARSTDVHTQGILDSLAWLGMTSDEPLIFQSQSLPRYQQVIEQLIAQRHAYRCYCTPEELDQRLVATPYGRKYDGHCRNVTEQGQKPYVVRFKVPDLHADITFQDQILGSITIAASTLDDFVLMRSDGMPMYNFAVVVDDIYMHITHVIRGQEHIANTPKQLLLYQALQATAPQFAHLPVILNKEGGKLSKRDGAAAVFEYKEQGFLAEALINFLARLGWAHGNQELFSTDELIRDFDVAQVGKSNAVFDSEKLLWVNGEHIKRGTAQQLYTVIVRDIDPAFEQKLAQWDVAQRHAAIALYQPRAHTLCVLRDEVCGLLLRPVLDAALVQSIARPVCDVLVQLAADFKGMAEWTHSALEAVIKQRVAQTALGIAPVAHALRGALTGKTAGAGIFVMVALIGKEESISRIEALVRATNR